MKNPEKTPSKKTSKRGAEWSRMRVKSGGKQPKEGRSGKTLASTRLKMTALRHETARDVFAASHSRPPQVMRGVYAAQLIHSGIIKAPNKALKVVYEGINDELEKLSEMVRDSASEELEAATEALVSLSSLDADQLVLAQYNADERRRLMTEYEILGPSEFSELMPALATGSNVARTLGRMRDRGELLAVSIAGDWKYPALQVNPDTNEPFPALQALIPQALADGYTYWEILSWLTSPADTFPEAPEYGQPLDGDTADLSPDALLDLIEARHPPQEPPPPVFPVELLWQGDDEGFRALSENWLGGQA